MELSDIHFDEVLAGIAEGSRHALLRHKLLGESVVTRGADGKTVVLPAQEIKVPAPWSPGANGVGK
jgi:hypothetical protein